MSQQNTYYVHLLKYSVEAAKVSASKCIYILCMHIYVYVYTKNIDIYIQKKYVTCLFIIIFEVGDIKGLLCRSNELKVQKNLITEWQNICLKFLKLPNNCAQTFNSKIFYRKQFACIERTVGTIPMPITKVF